MQVLFCPIYLTRKPSRKLPREVFQRGLYDAVTSVQEKVDDYSSKGRILCNPPQARIKFHPPSGRLVVKFLVQYDDPPEQPFFGKLFGFFDEELKRVPGVTRVVVGESRLTGAWLWGK
ncbi:MAG: hypothetical protein A3H06_01370 [Candidatus Colwellbacteria bacterium RIFCSPLOWO2_12_FULL_44_13]|uniref:Uncharacterized protein n=1 Tax=Candidatus Colwellbacteria bacterium RIFCSPLOWO2_12_FULL_44_13 TaxID=1797694 RepID=A0A1G1Z9K1_9BACT|nr:MAG: hypothetical protein A3H06_01370 [Candidatus Colwellbacteria bacterium RIFCSPLOWO2_12_FULL_44_13]